MKKNVLIKRLRKRVLIDTWWNVNGVILPIKFGKCKGFNRYMVECE